MAEDQARKVGESIGQTKSEAEALAASTGNIITWGMVTSEFVEYWIKLR